MSSFSVGNHARFHCFRSQYGGWLESCYPIFKSILIQLARYKFQMKQSFQQLQSWLTESLFTYAGSIQDFIISQPNINTVQ